MEKMLRKALLKEKSRNNIEIAKILNVSVNAISQRKWRLANGVSDDISNKLFLRILTNIDDDILDFFLNDDNFTNFKVKKD